MAVAIDVTDATGGPAELIAQHGSIDRENIGMADDVDRAHVPLLGAERRRARRADQRVGAPISGEIGRAGDRRAEAPIGEDADIAVERRAVQPRGDRDLSRAAERIGGADEGVGAAVAVHVACRGHRVSEVIAGVGSHLSENWVSGDAAVEANTTFPAHFVDRGEERVGVAVVVGVLEERDRIPAALVGGVARHGEHQRKRGGSAEHHDFPSVHERRVDVGSPNDHVGNIVTIGVEATRDRPAEVAVGLVADPLLHERARLGVEVGAAVGGVGVVFIGAPTSSRRVKNGKTPVVPP